VFCRHAGENRHPEVFENSGFLAAPAIASLPGMTFEFIADFLARNITTL